MFYKSIFCTLFLSLMLLGSVGYAVEVNTNDDNDGGAGTCDVNVNPHCSLREAINNSGDATITFDDDYTITLDSELIVDRNVTITGTGATIIQAHASEGSATNRVFTIKSGITVTIENLTIRHGNTDKGGGIYIDGSQVIIENTTISGNTATTGGGGIYITKDSSNITINDSSIVNNTETDDNKGGAGINVFRGNVTIENTIIAGNSCKTNSSSSITSNGNNVVGS
ncbi:MAG: hypothetical protein IMF12_07860, partial [Proteobacteria bacterium]|nr:hypothetical protein [Pseudomonadota bacterium]